MDVHRFRRLLERARLAEGDESAVGLFRQALSLWRGEPFAGVDTPWFNRARAALEKERLAAELDCADARLRLGEHTALVAALSLLVRSEDYIFSHHRSHGYYFAKGSPLRELFAELYGKSTGACGGKAGSQDISHTPTRFYSGAILAGAINIAAGAAFGLMLQKRSAISVSGFGEAATEEGAFWEVMNFAGARKLPALFICENNRYSTYSDQMKRQATDNIAQRVSTFGVHARRIFGNDIAKVFRTLREAMERVRSGKGPVFVEAYTYRWNGHVGPDGPREQLLRPGHERP